MSQVDEWVPAGSESWRDTPCKIWTNSVTPKGYGKVYYKNELIGAHKREYILHRGSVPFGFVVMHRCHNPPCYEIKHLELGTQQENMQDAGALGTLSRDTKGVKNSNSKLTEDDVLAIRKLHSSGGVTNTAISKMYGVSSQLIGQIVRRVRWSHV